MELTLHHSPVQPLPQHYDIEKIKSEVCDILSSVHLDHDQQLMLTSRPNSPNPNFEGKGKIYDKIAKKFLFRQEEFSCFNPNFKGGYLEKLWQNFPYPIGRFRIAVLAPHRCYSLHRDHEDKFHIPVITNKHCYLLFYKNPEWYHLPADGSVYKVATSQKHSAANMGDERRIHLLLDSRNSYQESTP